MLITGLAASLIGCAAPARPTDAPAAGPPTPVIANMQPTPQPISTATAPPPLTPSAIPCTETAGQVQQQQIQSAITGAAFRYRIYLPPCYAARGVRYPYLIMLHGMGAGMDDSMWDNLGLDEAATAGYLDGSLPPMIIVLPNGEDAQQDYDPGPYPRVLVEELIPHIEANTCAWGTPQTRGIGGLSRGGFWAFSVAMQHPDLFERVGGHSAFFYDGEYPPANPSSLVESAPGIERLVLYLDHGATDTLVNTEMAVFMERARARGLAPRYRTDSPGGHDNAYWAAQAPAYLQFYSEAWPRDAATFPPC